MALVKPGRLKVPGERLDKPPEFLLGQVPLHLVDQVRHEDDTGFVSRTPVLPTRAPPTSPFLSQDQVRVVAAEGAHLPIPLVMESRQPSEHVGFSAATFCVFPSFHPL